MSSTVGSAVPSAGVTSRATIAGVSLFRLYTLRASYLLIAVGLSVHIWPAVFHHTQVFAATEGVRSGLLAGLVATAVLGPRYPLQMLPLLMFGLIWKAIYLIAFALPLWYANRIDAAAEDIKACLMVVVFIPLIPWRYVLAHYVRKHGDRWK
jgi:hypothetical protein